MTRTQARPRWESQRHRWFWRLVGWAAMLASALLMLGVGGLFLVLLFSGGPS